MRTLLIVVTVAAVASAALPYLGIAIFAIVVGLLLLFVVPVCLGTLAWYCCGHRQTFFLGAFAGSFAPFVFGGAYMVNGLAQFLAMSIVALASSAVCGGVALATRRFLERRGWHLPENPRDPSSPR